MTKPTNKKVFISFAGERSKLVAMQLKEFIDIATGNKNSSYLSVLSNKNSEDWYKAFSDNVINSTCFIGLLDSNYFGSFYAMGEYAISLTNKSREYLFFLLDGNTDITNTPLSHLDIPMQESSDKLADYIITKTEDKIKTQNLSSDETQERLKKIKAEISKILNEYSTSISHDIKQVKQLVKEIEGLAIESISNNSIGVSEDPLKRNYIEMPKELLIYAHEILFSIARKREIPVELPRFITKYWSHNIMGTAKSSVWTTNFKGTHGRSIHEKLITTQIDAATRGVKISRIFVFNEKDLDDVAALQAVAFVQLYNIPKIKNFLIQQSEYIQFHNRISNLGYESDFMIIDSLDSYSTYPHDSEKEVAKGVQKQIQDTVKTSQLQNDIIDASFEIKFIKSENNTNFINAFSQTEKTKKTIEFFSKHNIHFVLSRNKDAQGCEQAAKVRFRIIKIEDVFQPQIGIPLKEELKSLFGYYKKNKDTHLIVLNMAGDQEVDIDKLKSIFGLNDSDYIRLNNDANTLMEHFDIKFAEVNPFLISTKYDRNEFGNRNNEYKSLTIVYDRSLSNLDETTTLMTNAGELSWGIEFKIADVLKIQGDRFIYDKSFIKTY